MWISYKLWRKSLPTPDAIIPRIGASRTFYGAAMVRHFEMMDVLVQLEI